MINILHLISSCGFYGAEAMLVTLAKAQRQSGHDAKVGLISTESPGSMDVVEAAKREGIPVEIIPCRGRWDRSTVSRIQQIAVGGKVDILHLHGYKSDIYGLLATRNSRVKRIATCHDSGMVKPFRLLAPRMTDIYGSLDRLALRRFHAVAAVSEPIAEALTRSGVSADRVHVINNGIDLQRFKTAKPAADLMTFKQNDLLLGLIGRLAEGKGHEILLEVVRSLVEVLPRMKVVFVGDGPLQGQLEATIAKLGISDRVRLAGKRTDMPSVYAALDLFVLPSFNEGMPISVLEAMSAGTPVVASRVGGIPTLISNQETGILVEPGQHDSLQKAITNMLSSPESRAGVAENARHFVDEHYSAAAMAEKYLQLYRTTLRETQSDTYPVHDTESAAERSPR